MPQPIYTIPPYRVSQLTLPQNMTDLVGWGLKAIGADEPWMLNRGVSKAGRKLRLAVCDTGVDKSHLDGDLANVVEQLDATGTGPWDDQGHGTHVLSIAGARADQKGVVGLLPECELLSIRCLVGGSGRGEWISRAIDMARDRGADVINLSLGSPSPDMPTALALGRAVQAGIFPVVAAGNSGTRYGVNYPARWRKPSGNPSIDTLAIAALKNLNGDVEVDEYSAVGPEVDFAFPGSDIPGCWLDGRYSTISGTSMASPLAAAVVGLLTVRHWDLGDSAATPLKTLDQVREHFAEVAVDLGKPGRDDRSGLGCVKVTDLMAQEPLEPSEPDSPGGINIFGLFSLRRPPHPTDWFSVGPPA